MIEASASAAQCILGTGRQEEPTVVLSKKSSETAAIRSEMLLECVQ